MNIWICESSSGKAMKRYLTKFEATVFARTYNRVSGRGACKIRKVIAVIS